jgi:hypothetical protein
MNQMEKSIFHGMHSFMTSLNIKHIYNILVWTVIALRAGMISDWGSIFNWGTYICWNIYA